MSIEENNLEAKMQEEIERFKDDFEYRSEGYYLDITEKVLKQMEKQNINKAELAKRLNCSKSHITQLFKGTTNITLETLAKLAIAVNSEWEFNLISSEVYSEKPKLRPKVGDTSSEATEEWVFNFPRERFEQSEKSESMVIMNTGTVRNENPLVKFADFKISSQK